MFPREAGIVLAFMFAGEVWRRHEATQREILAELKKMNARHAPRTTPRTALLCI